MQTLVEITKNADQARAEVVGSPTEVFKDGVDQSLAGIGQFNAHSRQNLEAVVASAVATKKGAEIIGSQVRSYNQSVIETHVQMAKAIVSARSAQEIVELQSDYAKSALGDYLKEVSRASETYSAALRDAFGPLKRRTSAIMETMWSAR